MLNLASGSIDGSISSILCLGAHCDDIEIGCGGTVMRLLHENSDVRVDWIVFSSDERRAVEARKSAETFLSNAPNTDIVINDFRGRYFPYVAGEIKSYFDELGARLAPDLIFTHWGGDAHQDHRVVSELTWNTFRDHLILEYEIVKYDGDIGRPNVFVPLDRALCRRKVETITASFPSQGDKHWFSEETFWALLRLRGVECKAAEGCAEAFHGRKLVLR